MDSWLAYIDAELDKYATNYALGRGSWDMLAEMERSLMSVPAGACLDPKIEPLPLFDDEDYCYGLKKFADPVASKRRISPNINRFQNSTTARKKA